MFLGAALGIAPIGAWMAITGEWNWLAFLLGSGVLAWVAGFDVIYACQDYDFDLAENLFSIPKTFGIAGALMISRLLHLMAFSVLVALGYLCELGWMYFAGVFVVGAILLYEQSLVKPKDLSRVNVAFFNLNGVVSVMYFLFTAGDVFLLKN